MTRPFAKAISEVLLLGFPSKPSLKRAGRLAAYEAAGPGRSGAPTSRHPQSPGLWVWDPASAPIVDRDRKIRVRSVCKSARHASDDPRTERSDESAWSQAFLSMTPTARAKAKYERRKRA